MFMMVMRRIVILVLAAVASRHRPFLPDSHPPEDKMLKSKDVEPWMLESGKVEFSKDVRAQRIIGNDSENDPYMFVLLIATAVFSDDIPDSSSTRSIVYGIVYIFARVIYAISYIMALQPWRTLAFFVGVMCMFACSLDMIITMSLRSN